MADESFLCESCKRAMCLDCKAIAEEYRELLHRRTNALINADTELNKLRLELEQAKRRADDYQHIMELGHHKLLIAWTRSMSSQELRKKAEEV